MDDKELLELAAFAAGKKVVGDIQGGKWLPIKSNTGKLYMWSPLVDDADAFRIAVRLRFEVGEGVGINGERTAWVNWFDSSTNRYKSTTEALGEDAYSGYRRAITRAAAAIGQSMKEQGK